MNHRIQYITGRGLLYRRGHKSLLTYVPINNSVCWIKLYSVGAEDLSVLTEPRKLIVHPGVSS